MKFKIGQKIKLGRKGGIYQITGYEPETKTYRIESNNGMVTGFIGPGDAVMIPIKDYEQLKLF